MVKSENLTFSYNKSVRFAFPDIICNPGEALLITGSSGKGKTTLLHLLGGLLRAESGSIEVGGANIATLRARALDRFRGQNIGLVLQESHFIASLTVIENVVLGSWLATGNHAAAKAKTLLNQLGLADQMYKLPSQLSIGQQQRVSIARALINEPKLLLADEPTSSLDDDNAIAVAELLAWLAQEFHSALIIVTHDQRLKDRFQNSISL